MGQAEVVIKDFTVRDTTIKFKIYDEIFEASPELPLGMMQQMVKLRSLRDTVDEVGLDGVLDIVDMFILDESMERIRQMVNDKRKPFGVRHLQEIVPWLLEQYGLRPTQPSSNSSTGSLDGETGTSSTDGVQPAELTLFDSQHIESLT